MNLYLFRLIQLKCFVQKGISSSIIYLCVPFVLTVALFNWTKKYKYLSLWAQLCGSRAAVFITRADRDGTGGDNPTQGCRLATNGFILLLLIRVYSQMCHGEQSTEGERESCLYQLSLPLVCVQPPLP